MEKNDEAPSLIKSLRIKQLLDRGCEIFRKIFMQRWKLLTGQNWVNSPQSATQLIKVLGKKSSILGKHKILQMKMITSGDVNQWDLATVSQILVTINFDLKFEHTEKLKSQNEMIDQLKIVRNKYSHHSSKQFSNEEFNDLRKNAESVLKFFGDSEADIENLINETKKLGITKIFNPENISFAKLLLSKGLDLDKVRGLKDTIKMYTRVLERNGLTSEISSALYSNRCQLYLKASQSSAHASINDAKYAISDATKVLELSPDAFTSHMLAAQTYQSVGQHPKALDYFDLALGSDPTADEVRIVRDNCRLKRAFFLSSLKFDDTTVSKDLDKIAQGGYSDPIQHYNDIRKFMKSTNDPNDVFLEGRKYHLGEGKVSLDYKKALAFYEKASELGSFAGMACAGKMYVMGQGTQQNLSKGMKMLLAVANKTISSNYGTSKMSKRLNNLGILNSQYDLGLLYQEGVGVLRNERTAYHWFMKGAKEGHPGCLFTIAQLYDFGKYLPQNTKRALQYWKAAAISGFSQAMIFLAEKYLELNNIPQAKIWFQCALEHNNQQALTMKEDFEEAVKSKAELESNEEYVKWEKTNNLRPRDLSNRDREARMVYSEYSLEEARIRCLGQKYHDDESKMTGYSDKPFIKSRFPAVTLQHYKTNMEKYKEKAGVPNMKSAVKCLNAINSFITGINLLEEFQAKSNTDAANKSETVKKVIYAFSEALSTEEFLVPWTTELFEGLYKLTIEVMKEKPDGVPSVLDKKTKIIYVHLNWESGKETSQFCKKCIMLYPNEPYFWIVRCELLGYEGSLEDSVREANEALEKFPKNPALLYRKAIVMGKLANQDALSKQTAYRNVNTYVSKDYPHLPEIFYLQSVLQGKAGLPTFKTFYDFGVLAEKCHLPCFPPLQTLAKTRAQYWIESYEYYKISEDKTVVKTKLPFDRIDFLEFDNGISEFTRLTSPIRVRLFKKHRSYSVPDGLEKRVSRLLERRNIYPTKKIQDLAEINLINIQSIRFLDMHPIIERIYEDHLIHLTVIEDPVCRDSCLHLIVEDDDREATECRIFNYKGDSETLPLQFGFGCKFSVLCPYMQNVDKGSKPLVLHVDEMDTIIFHPEEKIENRCRFCGKNEDTKTCSKCKKALYCNSSDKQCQKTDWKLMQHSLSCKV